jgi:6-phosphogluconolactonase
MNRLHFAKTACVAAFLAATHFESLTHAQPVKAATAPEMLVYIGTYTGPKSKGIYVSRMDSATGKLSSPELAAEVPSPSFLAIHPKADLLYAVSEISEFNGKKSGAVGSFRVDRRSGKLTLLNQKPSGGDGPCHLVVDRSGKAVLVANYGGGSVAALPILDDGSLKDPSTFIQHQGSSVNPQRQKEPHAHSINVDPANRFACAADLGLDKVLVYRFDPAKGSLAANNPPSVSVKPGAGPRHFDFHPSGRYAYVINELDCTVTGFSFDADRGQLRELQTISTLPEGQKVQSGFSTAEIRVHPSGKFLYGSNRGHDTIVVFALDDTTGKLRYVENRSTQGKIPRNFNIDPNGNFLLAANQDSHDVFVFRIDQQTGRLTPTGSSIEVGSPVCVRFVPAL